MMAGYGAYDIVHRLVFFPDDQVLPNDDPINLEIITFSLHRFGGQSRNSYIIRRPTTPSEDAREMLLPLLLAAGVPFNHSTQLVGDICAHAMALGAMNGCHCCGPRTIPAIQVAVHVHSMELDSGRQATMQGPESEAVDRAASAENCTICLEELGNGVEATQLACSHVYHDGCIGRWLETNSRCPLCRCELCRLPSSI